jgi:hypothetical protein
MRSPHRTRRRQQLALKLGQAVLKWSRRPHPSREHETPLQQRHASLRAGVCRLFLDPCVLHGRGEGVDPRCEHGLDQPRKRPAFLARR